MLGCSPVRSVGRVERQVGNVACVETSEAFDLVGKSAVLVASLHELTPNFVEPLVMLTQEIAVALLHL